MLRIYHHNINRLVPTEATAASADAGALRNGVA
jgi:hypothetical protein